MRTAIHIQTEAKTTFLYCAPLNMEFPEDKDEVSWSLCVGVLGCCDRAHYYSWFDVAETEWDV